MTEREDILHWFDDVLAFMQEGKLAPWAKILPRQLELVLQEKEHGDQQRWLHALQQLPAIEQVAADLNRHDIALSSDAISSAQQEQLQQALEGLIPWRKGPFQFFGTHIDTEWRSDWKWQRVAPHLAPLKYRKVLDVGGGSGYHAWRMAGEGAAFVLVIDPSPRFYWQFQAVRHFVGDADGGRTQFLPVGIEDVPENLGFFDTVFSMGVLYHRPSPFEHLQQLKGALSPGGELVLETLVVEGDEQTVMVPGERYAAMPNVYFLPSSKALCHWLGRCGFTNVRVVDEAVTTLDEQRSTDWMTYQSLADFLDPEDRTRTIEGYPAPRRAVILADKPG